MGSVLKRRNEIVVTACDFDNFRQKEMLIQRSIFWAIMPCSMLKVNKNFRGMCCFNCCLLHTGFLLVSFINPEDGSDMSSETLVDFKWTSQCCIPENRTPHNQHCESLKSYRDTDIS